MMREAKALAVGLTRKGIESQVLAIGVKERKELVLTPYFSGLDDIHWNRESKRNSRFGWIAEV